jgi:hypothetical protein
MADPLPRLPVYFGRMTNRMARGNLKWANLENMDPLNYVSEIMIESPHVESSGMTNTMTRGQRREHYRRKAELGETKRKARYEHWQRHHPHETHVDWQMREQKRERRRAAERKTRKQKRRSSSSSRR